MEQAFGQCVTAEFDSLDPLCKGQTVILNNISQDAERFEWDFCSGDFLTAPAVGGQFAVPEGNYLSGIATVKDGNEWFSFISSRVSNSIIRLNYGVSLQNTPTVTNLGNLGVLSEPEPIKLIFENGLWYGIVHNSGNSNLVRLSFVNGLSSAPSAEVIIETIGESNSSMDLLAKDQQVFVAITGFNSNKVSLVNFHGSILYQPEETDVFTTDALPGSSGLIDVNLILSCEGVHAFTTSLFSSNVYRIDWGMDDFTIPLNISEVVSNVNFTDIPYRIEIVQEGGLYHGVISTRFGKIIHLNFGESFMSTPSFQEWGNFDQLNNTISLEVINEGTDWFIRTIDFSSKNLFSIVFENECGVSPEMSSQMNPHAEFSIAGNYQITLKSTSSGVERSQSKPVTIMDKNSPSISFGSQFMCANADVNFSSVTDTSEELNYLWTFPDGTTQSGASTVHQFSAPGIYEVKLEVEAQNDCINFFSEELIIYDQPSPAFTLPSGQLCTNNALEFLNDTPDNYDGNLSFEWLVDEILLSTDRNLVTTFDTQGSKIIKLIASIPGCSAETSVQTSSVENGPAITLSHEGGCEDESIQFNIVSNEPVDHEWDFGDGITSTDVSPTKIFTIAGVYLINYAARNQIGCITSIETPLLVHPKPSTNFTVEVPPLSCTDSPTAFINLTTLEDDSPINSWYWNFGDSGDEDISDFEEPEYTYLTSGEYNVTLTAVSDQNCSASITKPITIHPSPIAEITSSAPCDDKPTTFLATGDNIKFYYWEMGTSYYEVANPTHVFTSPGQYDVKLVLTGENNCVTTYDEVVVVPEVVVPDFSFEKNCVGFETQFTDLTAGDDPVESYAWDFAGEGTSNDHGSTSFQFNSIGSKAVSLQVLTQSGCVYSKIKNINVVPAPVAIFTASTESGAVPLEVEFTNTSTGANSFSWDFGNTETSPDPSPTHTYNSLGDFEVKLTASNPQGCENSFVRNIVVESPTPDVELKLLSISENPNGTLKLILTIQNNGNTVIRNLPVEINISGKVALTEIVNEAIRPAVMYNLVLDYGINTADNVVQFICAETTLENDLNTNDNRICKDVEQSLVILEPYPNPVNDELNVEWIATDARTVSVMLTDMFGKTVLQTEVDSKAGLNRSVYNTEKIQAGLYILTISDKNIQKTVRIFISNQN